MGNSAMRCPRCSGGGWIDAFDRGCQRGDFHSKCECRLCNASGRVEKASEWHQCRHCQGKGGLGVLGPCCEHCIHFRRFCDACEGKGWIHEQPPLPPVPQAAVTPPFAVADQALAAPVQANTELIPS